MKDLHLHGVGSSKKQAEPREDEENCLWELGLLGDLNAQTLLDTMVWMCDLYFALCSGVEDRNLHPDQIKLFEPPGSPAYLLYTEDASKNNFSESFSPFCCATSDAAPKSSSSATYRSTASSPFTASSPKYSSYLCMILNLYLLVM